LRKAEKDGKSAKGLAEFINENKGNFYINSKYEVGGRKYEAENCK
jgi:hypothetical protein